MKKIINSKNAPAPIGPYNQALRSGNIVFFSGQVALDSQTGEMINDSIEVETNKVLDNIGAILKEAGLGFDDVIKSSIFLIDMNDFTVVNEIYGGRFSDKFPARETVQVSRLPKDARIEISVIAAYE